MSQNWPGDWIALFVDSFAKAFQEFIPIFTRPFDLAGLQRNPDALRGVIRSVNGEMTPPGPSIIPEVMIGVCFVYARGQPAALRCLPEVREAGFV